MHVVVVGFSHLSAPLSLREQLSPHIQNLKGSRLFDPLPVILSTCNRCEVYLASHDIAQTHQSFITYLRERLDIPFEENLYTLFNFDAFSHLTRVCCGFESARVFETEIQGQVRSAYESIRAEVPKALHLYFQNALKISKRVRTEFQTTLTPPSLATLVQGSLEQHFGSLRATKGLVVGVSAINKPLLHRLSQQASITVCNRTESKAIEYAKRIHSAYLSWEQLPTGLDSYDWVVSATTTPTYIITPDMVDRNSALQFCIDLGVPRNIDPSLSSSTRRVLHLDELTDRLHLNRSRALHALEVTLSLTESAWGKIHTKI